MVGEYQLSQTSAGDPWPGVVIPGTYSDSSIAFDLRFVNPTQNVAVSVGCRFDGTSHGYFAEVRPQLRTAAIVRFEGTNFTNLVPAATQSAVQRDASNHIELRCAGTNFSLFVNSNLVASAQDASFASGRHYINAGDSHSTADARLANLVVTQQ